MCDMFVRWPVGVFDICRGSSVVSVSELMKKEDSPAAAPPSHISPTTPHQQSPGPHTQTTPSSMPQQPPQQQGLPPTSMQQVPAPTSMHQGGAPTHMHQGPPQTAMHQQQGHIPVSSTMGMPPSTMHQALPAGGMQQGHQHPGAAMHQQPQHQQAPQSQAAMHYHQAMDVAGGSPHHMGQRPHAMPDSQSQGHMPTQHDQRQYEDMATYAINQAAAAMLNLDPKMAMGSMNIGHTGADLHHLNMSNMNGSLGGPGGMQ